MFLKIILTLDSYTLLFILQSFIYYDILLNQELNLQMENLLLYSIIVMMFLSVGAILFTSRYLFKKLSVNRCEHYIRFQNIKLDKEANLNFMLSYLLPLLSFSGSSITPISFTVQLVIMIFFILLVTKAEKFNFNLLLTLLGYSFYKGENTGHEKILIIKNKDYKEFKNQLDSLNFVRFANSDDVYICKRSIVN